jgi:hypothetical protein
VLGVPSRPGAAGLAALALGLAVALALAWRFRSRRPVERADLWAAVALLAVVAAGPYLMWRVVSDLRVTTAMTPYDRSVAGPVQAYLQPYLLDSVVRIIPPGDTYATAVGDSVPYSQARSAFPSLALQRLYPRVSTVPARAAWIVAWGIDPRAVAPVGQVIVARRASGPYPAVRIARVLR